MDRQFIVRTVFDVVSISSFVIVCYSIADWEPFHRGFWCNDETIKYPRHDETISSKQLMWLALYLPFIFIVLTEAVHNRVTANFRNKNKQWFRLDRRFWTNLITVLGSWLFVVYFAWLIVQYLKLRVGRLRPIFIDVCKPSVSCDDEVNKGRYITDFTCDKDVSPRTQRFVRSSFPSGHSSEISTSMVFMVVYLAKRFNFDAPRYMVAGLQSIPILVTIYVAMSRIGDNIHHWQDVVVGLLIGSTVALLGTLLPGRLDNLNDKVIVPEETSVEDASNPPQMMETLNVVVEPKSPEEESSEMMETIVT